MIFICTQIDGRRLSSQHPMALRFLSVIRNDLCMKLIVGIQIWMVHGSTKTLQETIQKYREAIVHCVPTATAASADQEIYEFVAAGRASRCARSFHEMTTSVWSDPVARDNTPADILVLLAAQVFVQLYNIVATTKKEIAFHICKSIQKIAKFFLSPSQIA